MKLNKMFLCSLVALAMIKGGTCFAAEDERTWFEQEFDRERAYSLNLGNIRGSDLRMDNGILMDSQMLYYTNQLRDINEQLGQNPDSSMLHNRAYVFRALIDHHMNCPTYADNLRTFQRYQRERAERSARIQAIDFDLSDGI